MFSTVIGMQNLCRSYKNTLYKKTQAVLGFDFLSFYMFSILCIRTSMTYATFLAPRVTTQSIINAARIIPGTAALITPAAPAPDANN